MVQQGGLCVLEEEVTVFQKWETVKENFAAQIFGGHQPQTSQSTWQAYPLLVGGVIHIDPTGQVRSGEGF